MASQSAIAEGGSIVSADAINYQQKMFSHPSYKFEPQFPNTFGQPINLTASRTPVTINLPPEVMNLSRSYLLYTVTLPTAGATQYTWTPQDTLSEISQIQFYAGSNMLMVDVDNLQNYLNIVLKKETSNDEFQTMDAINRLYPSNSLVNVVPALRNSNDTSATSVGGPANPSAVNYIEPAYWSVGALNGAVTYNVLFPLRLIKNTLFSIDKNLYFGQTTYLKLYFGPLSKIAYTSTSNANPSAGTKISYAPAAGNATISGTLQLMLAVESNQDLRTNLIQKVSGEGISCLIPFVQAFKNSNQGTAQNISIQLDQNNGRSLMKVIHALYNNFEDQDTMYDHANLLVPGVMTQKVQQYYTQLNGKRNQDIQIDCTPATGQFLDYMSHKRQLRGSVINNLNVYQQNWFHCDDFSDFGPHYDQDNHGELISGIPMSVAPLTWSFVGVVLKNATFQHYSWFVFVKKLTASPGTVIVQ